MELSKDDSNDIITIFRQLFSEIRTRSIFFFSPFPITLICIGVINIRITVNRVGGGKRLHSMSRWSRLRLGPF